MKTLNHEIETKIQQDIIANVLQSKYALAIKNVPKILEVLHVNIPENNCISFGYAAYAISKLNKPLSTMKSTVKEIKGVGEKTEKIILEILETKNSAYYNSLR